MNWGKGIVIAMSLFIVFIVVLVIGLMSQRVDLVSEDYYKKEINYEEELTAMKNAEALDSKIELRLQKEFILVQLPEEGDFKTIEVRLIRPDDNKLDKTYPIKGTRTFLIERKDLVKGTYDIEIHYEMEGKHYLQKKTIYN